MHYILFTSSIITKIFVLHTFNDIASFNFLKFCWFEQCINTLKFRVSAFKGCCFCFLLLPNLSKIARNLCQQMPGFSIPFAFHIWKYITKIRYEERAFDQFHLLPAYYIFFREILQNQSIVLLYFDDIWRLLEKCLSKSNNNQLILLSQYINVSIFGYTLLKWMKYKNRPTFTYYRITFWDFKSVPKTWRKLKAKYNFLKKMPKYQNNIYYDFKSQFLVVFSRNYQHRLVLKIPFS